MISDTTQQNLMIRGNRYISEFTSVNTESSKDTIETARLSILCSRKLCMEVIDVLSRDSEVVQCIMKLIMGCNVLATTRLYVGGDTAPIGDLIRCHNHFASFHQHNYSFFTNEKKCLRNVFEKKYTKSMQIYAKG